MNIAVNIKLYALPQICKKRLLASSCLSVHPSVFPFVFLST